MKKFVASVSMVALGASSLELQQANAASMANQPLSASITLRGFYDDNINTAPAGATHQKSFGYEVSPNIGTYWGNDQTTVSANYIYAFRYYDKRPAGQSDKYSQDHTFNVLLDHSFTERYEIKVRDSFVIGQEPDSLRTATPFTAFQRIPGNNIANAGSIIFNAQLTPLFGLEAGYNNSYVNYADSFSSKGFSFSSSGSKNVDLNGNIIPSRSGELDRIEQTFHLDGRWQAMPQTTAVIGYQYGQIDYTGDEPIAGNVIFGPIVKSEDRNSRSHYIYGGADHTFRPDLTGSIRAGAQYIDHYNDPTSMAGFSPYVQASLSYRYAEESYVSASYTQSRSATDIVGITPSGKITQDTDTSVINANVRQRIIQHLYGTLIGTFQNSFFNGGLNDGQSEQYYLLGLDLEYQFNRHLSAHTGYNYDRLESQIVDRSFDRNRIYIGITASY
jgi:hypothetical protein